MSSPGLKRDESDSEDDNFNPAPADLSDAEDEPQESRRRTPSPRSRDDDDDQASTKADSPRARERDDDEGEDEDGDEEVDARKNAYGDDDEDDEEDEEDDDDDIQQSHRRKRHKRDRHNPFFDIEAEVEDEDEGEDDENDGEAVDDFVVDRHNEDIVESGQLDDDVRHRELDQLREMEASLDAEKQAEILKERYGNRRPLKSYGDSTVVPRRLLLPSVDDPSIWAVRCKEGKEREVVMSIMKKIVEQMGSKNELGITAAFERGGTHSVMKGYIYVEALRATDIQVALDGMMNVYPRSKTMLIEIKDMPDLLRVTKTPSLEPGAWVRLRRPPKHAGDLAQVLNITENNLEARVRFIPRLDLGRDDFHLTQDGKRKRQPGVPGLRPPQRLFSEAEARKRSQTKVSGSAQTNTWSFNGDDFDNGFQIKDIRIQLLTTKDVNPTLEEVTRFAAGGEDGTENLDLKALAASLKDSNANVAYVPGDVVEVYDGEQKGVVGRATTIQGDIVTITVTAGDLKGQSIEVPTKSLRKRFQTGDHVKVIGGRFRDEVGMVIKIDDDRVTFLTDQNNTEVTVFSKDLREASDIGGQGSLGQYALLDLVQLDPTTVACIVKVDRESFVVLDQNGDTRQIMPSQIANVLPKRKTAVAADRNGSEIRLDDVVREFGGQQRQGKIIAIHRSFVFLHRHDNNENAGVFVTRASNVNTIAAKGGRINATTTGPDLNAMNPALKRLGANENGSGNMAAPQKVIGRDRAMGQTVTIRKGGYKGLLGIVKDTTDTLARVELHTKGKIVTVNKSDLIFKDKVTGRTIDINARGGMSGRGGMGSGGRGGMGGASSGWDSGGRTPQVSSGGERTPAWGLPKATAHTPAWNRNDTAGSRTPAWAAADGSRTVNPHDGSWTSYGGGSRTPAWSSGAKTPAYDGFGQGSKTPAYGGSDSNWGAGSKTPAYGVSAPTPGASGNDSWGYTPGPSGSSHAYDAPTPGAGLGAPTPGGLNAPTPAPYQSAPTPAVLNAPTPGAGWQGGWAADSAPTPAAGAPTPAATGYYGAPTPGAYGGAPETPAASGPRYTDDD